MYWMQKVLKRNLSSTPFYDIHRERERGRERVTVYMEVGRMEWVGVCIIKTTQRNK